MSLTVSILITSSASLKGFLCRQVTHVRRTGTEVSPTVALDISPTLFVSPTFAIVQSFHITLLVLQYCSCFSSLSQTFSLLSFSFILRETLRQWDRFLHSDPNPTPGLRTRNLSTRKITPDYLRIRKGFDLIYIYEERNLSVGRKKWQNIKFYIY